MSVKAQGRFWSAVKERPQIGAFIALYAIALVCNVSFGLISGFKSSPSHLEADEYEYYRLAQDILSGTLEPNMRRTLGFPLVLAAFMGLGSSFLVLQLAICSLYSFSPPLLSLIVRKLGGSVQIGFIAGLALALWPVGIYFGTSLYSETFALPIFLLCLYILPVGGGVGFGRRLVMLTLLAGVVLGLATHVRPMYLIALPFIWFVIAVEEGRFRPAMLKILALTGGFAIVILPWSAMMSARFDQFILITSNGGETLSGGLNPKLLQMELVPFETPGRSTWVGPGKWLPIGNTGFLSAAELRLPYSEQDVLLRRRTVAWALQNPGATVSLEIRKLSYMWGIYPITENGPAQSLFGNIPIILLLAAGIWFFLTQPGERRRLVRLWMLPLFVSAVALISWGSWRFRQPADAGLIAFCVLCAWQNRFRQSRGDNAPP